MKFPPRPTLRRVALPAFALLSLGWLCAPSPDAAGSTLTTITSDNGLPARAIQWTDANGQPRWAVMVDQRPAGAQQGAGYLRQLTYRVNGMDRVCRGTGADGHQGDGYVENHTALGGDTSSHSTPGTTAVVLAGSHHVIITYDMPTYQISNHTVPTTVQWFFADGRSHPIYALTQDARGTPGNLRADSRSPYGDVAYDGGIDAPVGGASFGDTYKFVTLAANPEQVTRASGWRYIEPNTIPYAMQWTDPAQADAEMGHVATVPIGIQDQGSDPRTSPTFDVRATQQLNGPMIDDEDWAYQILNYILPPSGPTSAKRLTWGTNFGLPGGFDNYGDASLSVRQYSQHSTDPLGKAYSGTRADGMLMAYSVFVVLGTHSGGYKGGTVSQVVIQMENTAQATMSAATGTVKTSGPAGVGNAASVTVTYTPAGYNPVYSTWEVVASANSVDATLTPPADNPLDHPILVVNGYTLGQLPAAISVGNGRATPDVDYFATLDPAGQRLWISVNRLVTGPMNLKVVPSAAPQPPTITAIPANGTVGTSIVITGMNFTGATAVTFNGSSATFTVDSPTQITAVAPAASTAGPIAVTTPAGSGTSATTFTPSPRSPEQRPFPQHVTYVPGTIKPAVPQSTLDQTTQSFYDAWKARYLVNGCQTNQYYVSYALDYTPNPTNAITVSEAHGYGMMITALMAGYDPNARAYFDGMYRFYTNHFSALTPYLMGWQEVSPDCAFSAGGDNSATDGDMDIAYALLLADRQWGSTGPINYLSEGRKATAAVMKGDINTNIWSVRLGDWATSGSSQTNDYSTGTRPSDFMMDHFRVYRLFGGDTNWGRVLDKCYQIIGALQINNSPNTGLIPDFVVITDATPRPAPPNYLEGNRDGDYAYNACRVPWRVATDYLVSGDPRAKTALDKINDWIRFATANDPANIKDGYNLTNGAALSDTGYNLALSSPFAVSALVDATNQVWLNNLWTNITSQPVTNGGYFGNTIKMIDLILLSGNWWTPALKPTLITNFSTLSNGGFSLQFVAEPQFTSRVQASIDLVHWTTLLTTNLPSGNFTFVDHEAPAYPRRFYRIVSP